MQENMDYKKHGDAAFRAKDFETAIEFYTEVSFYIIKKPYSFTHKRCIIIYKDMNSFCYEQFMSGAPAVSPTVLNRRCLCYLMSDMFREALSDAMQAQVASPECSIALYLQATCLLKLGMEAEAKEALRNGSSLEAS